MTSPDARIQVAIEGSGGQGIVLFGLLFAKAAALDGFSVSFVPVYGSTITGGRSRSDVILSKGRIMHPLAEGAPDILVIFDDDSYNRNAKSGAKQAFLGEEVSAIAAKTAAIMAGGFRVPTLSIASALGSRVVGNIAMLGFVAGKTGIVSPDSFREAIRRTVPKDYIELNLKAFEAGLAESGK